MVKSKALYPVKAKEGDEHILNPSKTRWIRVFTLDDGSKWTVTKLQKKLNFIYKMKFSTATVRGRLLKHTSPKKIFITLRKTNKDRPKGYQRPTTKEEEKSREMMRIALMSIGGKP